MVHTRPYIAEVAIVWSTADLQGAIRKSLHVNGDGLICPVALELDSRESQQR